MTAATTLGFMAGPLLGGWLAGMSAGVWAQEGGGGSFSVPFFTAAGWLYGIAVVAPFWLTAALLLAGVLVSTVMRQHDSFTAE